MSTQWAPIRCGLCGRVIPAMTGLEEIHNIVSHMAEHHYSVSFDEAMQLRMKWEGESRQI